MEIKFFNAKWCGPCKQMKPHIEELISEGYNIQEIDVDEQPEAPDGEQYDLGFARGLVAVTIAVLQSSSIG